MKLLTKKQMAALEAKIRAEYREHEAQSLRNLLRLEDWEIRQRIELALASYDFQKRVGGNSK